MLDKKQFWAIFLFEFKIGHKAVETICNINNAFGPRTASEHTVQRWFKKFCKGDERLEDEKCSGQPSEVDGESWEPSSKLILLQLHEKLPKNSTSTILQLFFIWSKLERWKSLISGCLMSWLKIKNVVLKCHLLIFYATTANHFSIGLWHAMKSALCVITSDNQLMVGWRRSSKALPKAKLAPKNGHGHCLVVCCPSIHYNFLNPSETITSEKYV